MLTNDIKFKIFKYLNLKVLLSIVDELAQTKDFYLQLLVDKLNNELRVSHGDIKQKFDFFIDSIAGIPVRLLAKNTTLMKYNDTNPKHYKIIN